MKTGLLIKELRIKKGLTQEELADLTELSTRTIQRIENCEVDPRAYTLQMIAKALDVEFSMFLKDNVDDNHDLQNISDKKWSAILHLSGLIPLIFPTLIIWNSIKVKTKVLSNNFHAAIVMQLCICLISIVGLWIYLKVNQPIPLIAGIFTGGSVSVINAIFVMTDKDFINPFIKNKKDNKVN